MAGFRPPAVLNGQVAVAVEAPAEPVPVRSRRAPRELKALAVALERLPASCADDKRFTLDRPDVAELRPICLGCALRPACAAYAAAARPEAGFWAGTAYPLPSEETR